MVRNYPSSSHTCKKPKDACSELLGSLLVEGALNPRGHQSKKQAATLSNSSEKREPRRYTFSHMPHFKLS